MPVSNANYAEYRDSDHRRFVVRIPIVDADLRIESAIVILLLYF